MKVPGFLVINPRHGHVFALVKREHSSSIARTICSYHLDFFEKQKNRKWNFVLRMFNILLCDKAENGR